MNKSVISANITPDLNGNPPNMDLKYNLKQLCDDLPRSIKVSTIVSKLDAHGISESTFRRHCKIKIDSKSIIGSDDLQVYAALFNCTLEDLLNKKVSAKPLKKHSKVIAKLGLIR